MSYYFFLKKLCIWTALLHLMKWALQSGFTCVWEVSNKKSCRAAAGNPTSRPRCCVLSCEGLTAWCSMNDGRSNSLKQAFQSLLGNQTRCKLREQNCLTIAVWHSVLMRTSFFILPLWCLCSNRPLVRRFSEQILYSGGIDQVNSSGLACF